MATWLGAPQPSDEPACIRSWARSQDKLTAFANLFTGFLWKILLGLLIHAYIKLE